MNVIRELVALLGLEVDEQSFAVGELAAHAVEKALELIGEAAREAIGLMADLIEETGALNDVAAETGLTTQRIQELTYAAKFSNLGFSELTATLRIFSRNVNEAAQGNEQIAESFTRAGVKVTDAHGKLRPLDQILTDVADKFQEMPAGAARTGLAMDLFGRSGAQLIPMLQNGSAGLAKWAKEAQAAGFVMSTDVVDAGDELGDSLDRLELLGLGLRNQVLGPLLPVLLEITQAVMEWMRANREVIRLGIERTFRTLGGALRIVYQLGEPLAKLLKVLAVDAGLGKVAFYALSFALMVYAGNAARAALASTISLIAAMKSKITVTETFTNLLGKTTTATRLLTFAEMRAAVVGAAAPYAIAAAWAAVIAVLALIIEDVYTFIQGGDSLFGRFGKWILKALSFNANDSGIVKFLKWLGLLVFDTEGAFDIAGNQIRSWGRELMAWLSGLFGGLGTRIGKWFEPIAAWFNKLGKVIGDVFAGRFSSAFAGILDLFSQWNGWLEKIGGYIVGVLYGIIQGLLAQMRPIARLLTGDLKGAAAATLDYLGPVGDWIGKNVSYGGVNTAKRSLDQVFNRNWKGGEGELLGRYLGNGASGAAAVSSLASSPGGSRSTVNAPSFTVQQQITVGDNVSPQAVGEAGRSSFEQWMNGRLADTMDSLQGG